MRWLGPILLAPVLALTACGPLPVAEAERVCVDQARLAAAPRGTVELGVGARNGDLSPVGRFEVEMSSDYIMGRDPAEVFNRCVVNRSGQMPTRPLADQPGWRTS